MALHAGRVACNVRPAIQAKRENTLFLRIVLLFTLTLASHLALLSTGSAQQTPPATSVTPLPSDASLDALVAARNWNELGTVMKQPVAAADFSRKLKWLKAKVDSGGSFFLAFVYARNLWIIGNVVKTSDTNVDPRVTAGLMTLYAYALIVIDGARCADRSAPDRQANQLLAAQPATLAFVRQLQPELISNLVNVAVALERKTAPLRIDDDLVCRGGMDEMRVSIERGQQRRVPDRPGTYGRSVEVTPPSDWTPELLSPEVYRPSQDRARASLREDLLKLVGLKSVPVPTKPLPSDADLTTLLTNKKWIELIHALTPVGTLEEFQRKLTWLKARLDEGEGFSIAVFYAQGLWTQGDPQKIGTASKDARLEAALITLYAFELAVIDGAKCTDQKSTGRRITELLYLVPAAVDFLKRQPLDVRSKIADQAIKLELKTAPLRKDDEGICNKRLAGRNKASAPPADPTPIFEPAAVYRPKQEKARAGMRQQLLDFIDQPTQRPN